MSIEKLVGRMVVIIYQDLDGQITQRRVRIKSADGVKVIGYDIDKKASRLLAAERILAYRLVNRNAS